VVNDAGAGISADHLPKVFDRFYKADPARPGGRGSGLGLAIARENARLHGGDVTVTSPPGAGATFTVRIPRRVAEPLPAGDPTVTTARHDRVL
jgi:two-component system sensor histidine kinase MtrB